MKLRWTRVNAIKQPGRYGDSLGLYLNVAPGGSKNWIQRTIIEGKRRDIGLGGYPTVSLAEARENARENRAAVAGGRNPLSERVPPLGTIPTFEETARSTHATLRGKWRPAGHSEGWLRTLSYQVFPEKGIDQSMRYPASTFSTFLFLCSVPSRKRPGDFGNESGQHSNGHSPTIT